MTGYVPPYISVSKIGHFELYVLDCTADPRLTAEYVYHHLGESWDKFREPRGDKTRVTPKDLIDSLEYLMSLEDALTFMVYKEGVLLGVSIWSEAMCLHYGVSVSAHVYLWDGVPFGLTREMYRFLHDWGYEYAVVSKYKSCSVYTTKYLKLRGGR